MSVDPITAFEFLHEFARFERDLKRVPGFLKGNAGDLAEVQWRQVQYAVEALPPTAFVEQVPDDIRRRLLQGRRDRPRVQKVELRDDGTRHPKFKDSRLHSNDAIALLIVVKRVRNNLFHGGKEESNGGNQAWVLLALQILHILRGLPWRRMGLALDQAG